MSETKDNISEIKDNILTKQELIDDPNISGYYRVKYDNGITYDGKLKNSVPHGFGTTYNADGEIMYNGLWVNGKPIEIVDFPRLIMRNPFPPKKTLDIKDTCQGLKFNYKNNTKEIFDLEYFVPFVSKYDLSNIVNKSIQQTELSNETNEIDVTIDNTECGLANIGVESLKAAVDINELAKYIIQLDYECSGCQRFNRGWVCCGQFAPFLFIYFILSPINRYKYFKQKYNFDIVENEKSGIFDVATVFYKAFTGYGFDDSLYHTTLDELRTQTGVSIPSVRDDENFWYEPYIESYTDKSFSDGVSYLINIVDGSNVSHFSFIYRAGNYIIICDSWASSPGIRLPVTRVVPIGEFIKSLNMLNSIYDNRYTYSIDELKTEMLLYNFIMDALFMVPYYPENIKEGLQSFNINDLSQIRIVSHDVIHRVFSELAKNDSEPFEKYLYLGGKNKKRQSKKRKSKKRKSKKRKINKSSKNKNRIKCVKYLERN